MLTASTVVPHLRILTQLEQVAGIVFITLEENKIEPDISKTYDVLEHRKVQWVPLVSVSGPFKVIRQIADTILHSAQLNNIVEKKRIEAIIAYGAPAGALASKVGRKSGLPFYVFSFEPHAAYMLETGVWNRHGLKYIFQKRWEQQQKRYAAGLMPVAENYKVKLLQEGVPANKIVTVPCIVNYDKTRFSQSQSDKIREKLGWQLAVIGIYVGKFGGLYLQDEAFEIYSRCFKLIPGFRLIILSPQDKTEIMHMLQQVQIDLTKVYVASVPHSEVPQYLSAADFAFATIKSYPSARYCSPVKIGEYWASGLPVLLTEGVGDDSDIIRREGGGALFNPEEPGSVERAIKEIMNILQDPQHRKLIPELARKYRSPDKIREAYEYFFGNQQEKP